MKPTGQISTPVRSNIVVVNQSQSQNTVTSKFKFYSLRSVYSNTMHICNTESWPERDESTYKWSRLQVVQQQECNYETA